MIAFQMQGVAFGWQMYALTSSTLDLGLIGLFQFVPAAALSLAAGQVADRYDRSRVLRLAQMVEAIAALMMLAATTAGVASREWIFAAAFIVGSARAFEGTTFQTVLPVIVPRGHLTRAIAALASAQQIATIGGPALGGLLYLFGPTLVYALCGALFLLAGTCMLFIKTPRAVAKREPLTLTTCSRGSATSPAIPSFSAPSRSTCSRCCWAARWRCCRPSPVTSTGPGHGGWDCCAPPRRSARWSISVALARAPLAGGAGRIMFACVIVYGVMTIVFALSSSFYLSMAVLAVLGVADMVSVVIRQTLIQVETPDEMRGRVSAVNSLFTGTANQLGDFRAGVMASVFGTATSVLIGGVSTLVVVAIAMRAFPALLRVDRLSNQ